MHTHSLSINSDPGRALRPWELALLLAVCVTLLTGTWAQARSQLLAARLVRLHVIAVSDDDAEQAVKLQVRDAVLAYLEPQLQGVTDVDAAQQLIAGDLDGIARAAQAAAALNRPIDISCTAPMSTRISHTSHSPALMPTAARKSRRRCKTHRTPTPAASRSRYRTIRPVMPLATKVPIIFRSANGSIRYLLLNEMCVRIPTSSF